MNRKLKIGLLTGLTTAVIMSSGCGGATSGFSPFSFGGLMFYNSGNLFTMLQNGSNVRPGPTNVFLGSMTFNRKIVTSRTISGVSQIIICNADGSAEVQLTNSTGGNLRPSVDPNGTKIAFISSRDGNNEIYVMNIDGTNQTRLTNDAGSDYFPSISADGTKIIFNSDRDGNEEVYSINVNGTGLTRLTNNAADDITPAWSEDGTEILFCTDRDGNFEIYRANANGTSPTRITTTAEDEVHASYSIDGSRIFYYDSTSEVRRINPDGSTRVTLSSGGGTKTACWVF
ncbi:MAG: PD40 domain-containing protein [Fimbriimonadaceae bacterium]|nr:PD40 domain-containing protein [Fimbriimonadaceae bacterium]